MCAVIVCGCTNEKEKTEYVDPAKGETVFRSRGFHEGLVKIERTDDDGYRLLAIVNDGSPKNELYELFTPNGNLRLIASGAQEQGGVSGYSIDYNRNGTVARVRYIGMMNDDDYSELADSTRSVQAMRRWADGVMEDTGLDCCHVAADNYEECYDIVRNDKGGIISIGGIDVPYGYDATFYLSEWGPFWLSDISGGMLAFFVRMECEDRDGSTVDYLYKDGKLLAEMAYWNGKFIKLRTYNHQGSMVGLYKDRDIDILNQAYEDYDVSPAWYVENQ